MPDAQAFLEKARESLASAEDDLAKGRFNACARNAYYAAFQAAVAALASEGIRPSGHFWGHDFVAAQFAGSLIRRRKAYPGRLRSLLSDALETRTRADYSTGFINRRQASDTLKDVAMLVSLVEEKLDGDRKTGQ